MQRLSSLISLIPILYITQHQIKYRGVKIIEQLMDMAKEINDMPGGVGWSPACIASIMHTGVARDYFR